MRAIIGPLSGARFPESALAVWLKIGNDAISPPARQYSVSV